MQESGNALILESNVLHKPSHSLIKPHLICQLIDKIGNLSSEKTSAFTFIESALTIGFSYISIFENYLRSL